MRGAAFAIRVPGLVGAAGDGDDVFHARIEHPNAVIARVGNENAAVGELAQAMRRAEARVRGRAVGMLPLRRLAWSALSNNGGDFAVWRPEA